MDQQQKDFPEEEGQVNATIAHCIERCWVYMLRAHHYTYLKSFNNCLPPATLKNRKRLVIYAHYAANNTISNDDLITLQSLADVAEQVIVVSNSPLSQEDVSTIQIQSDHYSVWQRENKGLDFGAWRDVLLSLGKQKINEYDELILCNNSFFPPVFPISDMIAVMEEKPVDFWGSTVFPYLEDGSYLHRDHIPEHLQSYWMAFNKTALNNDTFWRFWEQMPDYTNYIDVVANCESRLTELLAREGLTYEPYIQETRYMSRFLNNYALPYEKPSSLLLLGDTFIKKKCYQYMSKEEKIRLIELVSKLETKQ